MIAPAVLTALARIVGDDQVRSDPDALRAASSDYSWMSPVLRRQLAGKRADVVVRPGSSSEVARVLDVAYQTGTPVTTRGRGTGNYGQAVPLAGGIVIDTARLRAIHAVGNGWVTAEAGATFVELEAAARRCGQELAMFPSTVHSTIGGFLAGGAGGTGSIEHGFTWDGFVEALEVVGCLPDAEPQWVEGDDVTAHLHAFGTTGILTTVTVRLVPARQWTALLASFATWDDALDAATALLARRPLPRNLTVDEPALVDLLPRDPAMPSGRVSLRAIIEHCDVGATGSVVRACGGRVEAVRPDGVERLVSLSYNHITLRALQARPSLCHLQVGGPPLRSRAEEVRACLPGGMLHIDGQRRGGEPWLGGLLLSDYRDEATLAEGIARLAALGVTVVNPHTYRLGAHATSAALWREAVRRDPSGLLNPGKLPPAPTEPAPTGPSPGGRPMIADPPPSPKV